MKFDSVDKIKIKSGLVSFKICMIDESKLLDDETKSCAFLGFNVPCNSA